ncbi:unnamed protein product [Durusdinium trenchii]|uniref:Rab-GAP TBC domain-containing protein n=1 Tax=Durusdinium trenchii TaxID=1381693 RepID=A0ABP0STX0_9DINO
MSQGEDGGYLSAEDVQSVQVFFVKCQDFCHFDANGARLRSIIEANLPWTLQFDTFHVASPAENVKTKPKLKSWKAAIVGAHPSLCADIAHAVDRALGGQSEHQYFGLSCPGHHSASHHCTFRCEVLGQCSNDAMFDRILGQMLNWGEFTERPFDPKVLLNELRKIVSSSKFLSSADLQICTGPYVLCHMMQLILDVPLLVYLGLTLTYLAAENVEELLLSARSIASDFTNLAGAVGPRRRALVVTDLIRAAQFHHATGVWVPALPPLSFYHADPAQGGRHHRAKRVEAIALRPELWRRAAFGPGLRGLLRHFCNSNTGVVLWRAFIAHILTCIAPGGRGISNSFLAAQKNTFV